MCCEIPGVVCPDECFLSEPANEFGEDFCYTADEGSVIVGAVSTYDAATKYVLLTVTAHTCSLTLCLSHCSQHSF